MLFGVLDPVLDDGSELTAGIAHDAPVAGGILEIDREHRKRAPGCELDELPEARGSDQGHVPIEHEYRMFVGDQRHGLHHGVSGAELLGLQHPVDVLVLERFDQRAAVTVDDADIGGGEGSRGSDHVLEQRLARQGLQDFGKVRMHALALPRGEYDDGKRHGG